MDDKVMLIVGEGKREEKEQKEEEEHNSTITKWKLQI